MFAFLAWISIVIFKSCSGLMCKNNLKFELRPSLQTCSLQVCAQPLSAAAPDTGPPSRVFHWHGQSPRWGRCWACGSTVRPQWSARPGVVGIVGLDSCARSWIWRMTAASHSKRRVSRYDTLHHHSYKWPMDVFKTDTTAPLRCPWQDFIA